MSFRDLKIHPRSLTTRKIEKFPHVVTQSITSRVIGRVKPGVNFQLVDTVDVVCATYTATIGYDVKIVNGDGALVAGALTVHSTPEQLALALSRYVVGGRVVEKAAATAITFSGAHVVVASHYGIILVQINNAGTVSTKVPLASQEYDTAAEAEAALPAPDTGNVAVAKILILADSGNWVANTDSLTDDLTSATIGMLWTAAPSAIAAGGLAPVAGQRVQKALADNIAHRRGNSDGEIFVLATTDGTAVMANGDVEVRFRPISDQLFPSS